MREGPPVVAILNSNAEIIESLRTLAEQAGFVAVSGHIEDVRRGKLDLQSFIQQHDPVVVVYDLVPSYDRSWLYLESLRRSEAMQGRQFVLTSANVERVREVVGTDQMIYEIVGRPFDLDQIIRAITEASKARPV